MEKDLYTLKDLKKEAQAFRKKQPPKQGGWTLLPDDIKRRAITLIPKHTLTQIAQTAGVSDPHLIKKWQTKFAQKKPDIDFVEFPPLQTNTPKEQLRVQIEDPGSPRISIEGPIDSRTLQALIQTVLSQSPT